MEIYFIRHGDYDTSKLDAGKLTEKGRLQARKVGERFLDEKVKFDGIYGSIHQRARETTNICCEKMGFPLEKIVRKIELVEKMGWEDDEEVVERMDRAVDEILKKDGKSFAVFSHGEAILYLMREYCFESGQENYPTSWVMPHCEITLVNYALKKNSKDIWIPRIDEEYHRYKHLEEIDRE